MADPAQSSGFDALADDIDAPASYQRHTSQAPPGRSFQFGLTSMLRPRASIWRGPAALVRRVIPRR